MTIAVIAVGHRPNHSLNGTLNHDGNGGNSRVSNLVSSIIVVSPLNPGIAPSLEHPGNGEALSASQNSIEEDRYLGLSQQLQAGKPVAPPLPPRAPTDPEPPQTDDPADFDLPNQDKR